MRILMIAPQPFFQPRGTPFSVLHRLKALSVLGHHVDLITYHIGEDIPIDNVKIYRIFKIPFVTSIDIGPSFKKILCDIFLFCKAIRMLNKKQYDVLHTHEEAGFMAIILKFIYKIPHVYDMHSSLPQQLNNFKRGNIKIIVNLFKLLEKLTLKNSDSIITICYDLQKTVNEMNPELNAVLIENVADNSIIFGEENVEQTITLIRKKHKIPTNKKIILYTGTFEKYQGVDLLLKAGHVCLKDSGELIFVLVGGKQEQIEQMKKISKDCGIIDKVIFTGSVHPGEIVCFYGIATIIVSPRIEGTNAPLKIYSYLRSGRPIVATNCYTHTQVLNNEVALLVEPDPESFAQGIIKLSKDSNLCDTIVRNAMKLSATKYSYNEYIKKTEAVYKNIQLKKNEKRFATAL
jgi:glycosyltransferase involved in cell wall biosynthesis